MSMDDRFDSETALISPDTVGANFGPPGSLLIDVPHALSASETLEKLGINPKIGLDPSEAGRRLDRVGPNSLEQARGRSGWSILLDQFTSVVVWLLIAAAVVGFLTDSVLEGVAILVVLVLNALVGAAVEWRAGKALDALRRAARTTARVIRGGSESVIDSTGLVPGDVIIVSAGDRVPADARLIEAPNLRADESTLTGESFPVEKSVDAAEESVPIAERHSMIFLGTNIVHGRSLAVVTATGKQTELGRVGQLLHEAGETETPLEHRLADLGRRLVYVVLGIAAVVLAAGFLRGENVWLMAQVAISLAVAAVPEGLPAVTTLILALGLLRMARHSAIVRHLSAVETLGSTTVICTDKTGTLTENRMGVQEIYLADDRRVSLPVPSTPAVSEDLLRLLQVGILCSEATFRSIEKDAIGDPTETALLLAADQLGVSVDEQRNKHRKVLEVPFDAASKKMTAVFERDGAESVAMLKGAPAVVLGSCSHFLDSEGARLPLDDRARERFLSTNEEMAGRALRVLAFADKQPAGGTSDLDEGFTFLGLAGMTDPPRAEVPEAIKKAKTAGIRIVMLTGDQLLTAQAIARQLRLSEDHDVVAIHSKDLNTGTSLAELAKSAHVFARVSPEDKLRIVEALQRDGEIVAVTGDGINDAPALKRADIGVAMGKRGTDVAKEAADIVLTDDNFSTIIKAVEGGRTIYSNIIKFVHMMFSQNLAEVLVIFCAIIAGLPLPLLPLQILWINLVTDIFPALALAVEPAIPETMMRRPRSPKESLLSARFMFMIGWQGVLLAAIALGAYVWSLRSYGEGTHAHTVALFAVVAVQAGHLFNCRSRTRSAFSSFFSNPFIFAAVAIVIILQVLAVTFPPLMEVLGTVRPTQADWTVALLCFLLPIPIVEITKFISRLRR